MRHGGVEPLTAHGLQQVVEGVHIERLQGTVGPVRDVHEPAGQMALQPGTEREAVCVGQVHVEEHQVRAREGDDLGCLSAGVAFRN